MNREYENREEMITSHLPLVKKVVDRIDYTSADMDRDDMFSIGVIGLMDAVEKYDPQKGVPFESYARVRIRGTIIDEMRKSGKVSRSRIRRLNDYYEAWAALEQQFMREPTDGEICQHMGISNRELMEIHQTVNLLPTVSLEGSLFSGDREFSLYDVLEDAQGTTPDQMMVNRENRQYLQQALKSLGERDLTVLSLYYVEELTLKEIAHILEISVPRVSQIHTRILARLGSEIGRLRGPEEGQ